MDGEATISEQLKGRRLALGLTLADVARRAGTSAATLSRYENGWTRFETYTLRKLAAALGCELAVELRPRRRVGARRAGRAVAVAQLRRLFWDHPLTEADLDAHPVWVMERVLEVGNLADIRLLDRLMGRRAFFEVVAQAIRVSPRTRNFWLQMLDVEGMPCAKTYCRHTAWNS